MSKSVLQPKSMLKKRQDSDMSINDRFSDDEANRRRPCYRLVQKEKQRQLSAMTDHDRLNVLQEILFNDRNINGLIQKSIRAEKVPPKTNSIRHGKNQFAEKKKPSFAKSLQSSSAVDWNQSEEDNLSVNSGDEETIKLESIRLSRASKKDDQLYPLTRSASLHSQSNHRSNGIRSMNNVSFLSEKPNENINATPSLLTKLLDRLWFELADLESITGFEPNKVDLSSNTCSIALAAALITLTGHVRQGALSDSKSKPEINHLKDQLSVLVKTQLDFQQKIENQMTTLQTMMQTVCQLVNHEVITNKKCQTCTARTSDQTIFEAAEPRSNWLNNAQKPYLIAKDSNNAMSELLMFARRMNTSTTPTDSNGRHPLPNNSSTDQDTSETIRKLYRSSKPKNSHDESKHRSTTQESHLSMVSPIDVSSSYDTLESGLSNGSTRRNGSEAPSIAKSETILEKILQERLRLVQQMSELNKQHETTQEELANLEAKTLQSRPS